MNVDHQSANSLVRVEKGQAAPEEVAALTALLLARAAATDQHSAAVRPQGRNSAQWRRLERQSGFRAPHSWQS
ncbi:acyl-CoA carboxylase epsilon subunit [Streptomyces sp. TP-A0874]|uniref:acyl-CoA carboxylase epsilon subunit n=1 Tax=Streptomyces sp. TP-A0874 TaxID=549819 RepID=UPI000853DE9E|nr:acyl-CoA carboxylase epsilon subunit [Streptomyces sp. TP-A0874]